MKRMNLMFSQNIATKWFFYLDSLDRDSWFVQRQNWRSKHDFERNIIMIRRKEENQSGGDEESYVNVSIQCVCLLVCNVLMVLYY